MPIARVATKPVRVMRRDTNGVLVHADIKVKRLVYRSPMFVDEDAALAFVTDHGDPAVDYVTVPPEAAAG